MNTKIKKILIILIIILIIIFAGLLIYNFLIKKPGAEPNGGSGFPQGGEGQEANQNNEPLIPQPERKIKALSSEPVLAPTLTADKNEIIYYSRENGNVWQVGFDGASPTKISDAALDNLVKILWSPLKNKAISIFVDNSDNISKYFYDYSTKKALPLNKYINYIVWSPAGNKIAYQYQNDFTGENNISISNPDGSGFVQLLKTRMKNLNLEWPKGIDIFLWEKPSGLVQSPLYFLSSTTKSFNKIISDIYGFSPKWSPNGEKIIFSRTDSKGKNISIFSADKSGSNQKPTGATTLTEKCAWSQDPRIIYCAIPKNIEEAVVLPDDFYKGTFLSDDDFWKINTETNEKTKIIEDSELLETYDAYELFLSPQENYLFFVNKTNGLLYSIKLE
jgi:Tol biopolymer transport system component